MGLYVRIVAVVSWLFFVSASPTLKAADANELFESFGTALVQIKSMNIESGQKSSIGTGFFINNRGRIVTNYHVISDFIQSPEQYRLEFLDANKKTHAVKVINIDVINDLALLEAQQTSDVFFPLAELPPEKGREIFALGNPHDLGMIVVPGTYNGIKNNSFYKRIHFTGSINPGMSGGPTVDEKGQVVGINVATAGNQIGFLVPVERLHKLVAESDGVRVENLDKAFFNARINTQLLHNQSEIFQQILAKSWPLYNLGKASIPDQISEFIPCWGDSNQDKEKTMYTVVTSNCTLNERIYLSSNFTTGFAQMTFSWVQSDELNNMQLSNLYSDSLNRRYGQNNGSADEVTDFHCKEAIIGNRHNTISKGVTCVRAYRKYSGLFDVRYHTVLLEKEDQTLVGRYSLQGVTQQTANAFFTKYMESVKWN